MPSQPADSLAARQVTGSGEGASNLMPHGASSITKPQNGNGPSSEEQLQVPEGTTKPVYSLLSHLPKLQCKDDQAQAPSGGASPSTMASSSGPFRRVALYADEGYRKALLEGNGNTEARAEAANYSDNDKPSILGPAEGAMPDRHCDFKPLGFGKLPPAVSVESGQHVNLSTGLVGEQDSSRDACQQKARSQAMDINDHTDCHEPAWPSQSSTPIKSMVHACALHLAPRPHAQIDEKARTDLGAALSQKSISKPLTVERDSLMGQGQHSQLIHEKCSKVKAIAGANQNSQPKAAQGAKRWGTGGHWKGLHLANSHPAVNIDFKALADEAGQ